MEAYGPFCFSFLPFLFILFPEGNLAAVRAADCSSFLEGSSCTPSHSAFTPVCIDIRLPVLALHFLSTKLNWCCGGARPCAQTHPPPV